MEEIRGGRERVSGMSKSQFGDAEGSDKIIVIYLQSKSVI